MPFRKTAVPLLILAGMVLGGCRGEDPRLANLSAGLPKDSVLQVMGPPSATPKAYLMGGKYIEFILFRTDGKTGPIDGLARGSLTPLVIVDGSLTGWGWAFTDSVASDNRIRVDPAE